MNENEPDDPRVYQALALPNEALEKGGLEILRAGLIEDELYVASRRAFDDPAIWGEVLGEIARRIAAIYSLDETDLTEKEIIADIFEAFASEIGVKPVNEAPPAKSAPAKRRAKTGAKKSAKARTSPKKAPKRKPRTAKRRTKR